MALYLGYWVVATISQVLPPAAGYALAQAASWLWWAVRPAARRQVERNMAHLLGLGKKAQGAVSKKVFCNFSFYLFETFAMHRLKAPSVAMEGFEHLRQAYQAGRGVVLLTAHLGNWELGAKVLQSAGFRASAVALAHPHAKLNALFDEQRKRCGGEIIPLNSQATTQCLSALRNQRVLGLLADRDYVGDGVVLPFGQGNLAVPKGPAVLSMRAQSPIVPTFLIREGRWRFRLICKPALWPPKQMGLREAVLSLVVAYKQTLEEMVKRYPEQWLLLEPAFQNG